MSRSYRKHFCVKERNPYMKRYFNRRLRRKSNKTPIDIPSGGKYKTLNDSYEISDYSFSYPSYRTYYKEMRDCYDSDEECKAEWNKWYKNK